MVKRGIRRARRAERGAALFIVVLVILSLMGVGLFAARSSTMDVEIAGRYKQAGESQQVARFGMAVTIHELSRDPSTYLRSMSDTSTFGGTAALGNVCVNNVTAPVSSPMLGCYRFAYDGLEEAVNTDANGSYPAGGLPTYAAGTGRGALIQPGDNSTSQPGGIGYADIRPNFGTEMTDKVQLSWPVAGFQAGTGSNMRFYSVTLSGTGELVPRDPAAAAGQWGALAVTPAKSFMASVSGTRAQVTVGPLPEGI